MMKNKDSDWYIEQNYLCANQVCQSNELKAIRSALLLWEWVWDTGMQRRSDHVVIATLDWTGATCPSVAVNLSMVPKIYFLKVSCEQIHAVPTKALKGLYKTKFNHWMCKWEKSNFFFSLKKTRRSRISGVCKEIFCHFSLEKTNVK